MKLTLAENIRAFRRQRKMTQEKLAEALGVTVGAVYKWESGLSQPELNMIVEMADFFDVSVDVLLGYRMKDNRLEAVTERLGAYCRTLDPAALTEAEKALGKYPNAFEVVYGCAETYLVFGASAHDREKLRRALELLEQARSLLPQNTQPRISEATLCGAMSMAWFLLGEREKSVELLRQNNADGIFSSDIGLYLAMYMGRPEEAAPYLADGILTGTEALFNAMMGYVFVYRAREAWGSALDLIRWGIALVSGMRTEDAPDFLDKTRAEMLAAQAYILKRAGRPDESLDSLRKAGEAARRFDAGPDYSLRTMRFAEAPDQTAVFDILDATAAGSVAALIGLLEDPELGEQWKEICGDGK